MRGMLMADFNRTAEALASFEKAVALKPDYSKARWGACTAALPILYAEETEIAAQRADYERRLRALRAAYEAGHIPGDMSKGLGMAQPFFLAYQGHNDRELQSLFGGLATRIMADRYGAAELAPPPAPGEPVRVGIVSGFFYQHSVWKVGVRGWVSQLDPKRFQVFGYHTGSASRTPRRRSPRQHCHHFVQGPQLDRATGGRSSSPTGRMSCIYPGHRHEPRGRRNWRRCASRRCNAATSAIRRPAAMPTIDYFLSGELIEPPDGEEHYSEKLVRLPNIGFHYEPLELAPVDGDARRSSGCGRTRRPIGARNRCSNICRSTTRCFPASRARPAIASSCSSGISAQDVTELFQQRLDRAFAAAGLKADDHCVFLHSMST